MKCKDIKRMVIASSDGLQDSEELKVVRQHFENCTKCSHLKEDVESLRSLVHHQPNLVLPEELDKKTYQMCKSEIKTLQQNTQRFNFRRHFQSIPMHMKVVFISLLVGVVFWMFSFFEGFGLEGESLSLPAIIGLFLIIQNAVMLLFSPLLIRRFRSKEIQTQFIQ